MTTKTSCKNIQIKKRNDKFKLGTRFIRKINNVPYEGKVIGHRDQYYEVIYSDNDNEELTHYQIRILLKNKIKTGRERKEKEFAIEWPNVI